MPLNVPQRQKVQEGRHQESVKARITTRTLPGRSVAKSALALPVAALTPSSRAAVSAGGGAAFALLEERLAAQKTLQMRRLPERKNNYQPLIV